MHFGKAIQIGLIKKNKSREWLANKLGITKQAVSNMISQQSQKTKRLEEIADLLNMEFKELINLGEE